MLKVWMNLCISQNVPSYSPGTFHSSSNGIWIGQLSFFHPCSWYNDFLHICPCNHQCSYQLKKNNQFKCSYFHLKIDLCVNLLMDDLIQGLCFFTNWCSTDFKHIFWRFWWIVFSLTEIKLISNIHLEGFEESLHFP